MILLALLLVTADVPDTVTITFVVEAPAPDTLPVRVVGNVDQLGGWDAARALTLARTRGDLWSGTARIPRGARCSFTVVRGDWLGEAVTPEGVPVAEGWCEALEDTTVRVTVAAWKDAVQQPGHVRGERIGLGSVPAVAPVPPREVWVVVPLSYAKAPSARYPVLYVHDGQDAFDATLSSSGSEWRLDEIADSLSTAGLMPEIIIVAVAATPHRALEYADTTLGHAYARFVATELRPVIDRRFRTLVGRSHTATMGRSLGGLAALLSAWTQPEVFGQAACISPFLAWGDNKVLTTMAKGPPLPRPRLLLSEGRDVSDSGSALAVDAACSLLVKQGWVSGSQLRCIHGRSTSLHGVAVNQVADALLFLFPVDGNETSTDTRGGEDDPTTIPD